MILVDTSVWIEVFRRDRPLDLLATIDLDDVVTCLPVIQEVLQGFDDDRGFRIASEAINAFPCVESPLPADVFEEAVFLYRSARRKGVTVRSGVDCLIAVCALRHGLTILHRDRDFTALSGIVPLSTRRI